MDRDNQDQTNTTNVGNKDAKEMNRTNDWKRRTKEEICQLYNTNIINFIGIRKLQWLDHLQRMVNEREVKSATWKKR